MIYRCNNVILSDNLLTDLFDQQMILRQFLCCYQTALFIDQDINDLNYDLENFVFFVIIPEKSNS